MNQAHHYPSNLSSVYIQKRNYELHKNKLVDIEVKQRPTFIKSVSPSPIQFVQKQTTTKNFIQNEKNSQIRKENTRLLDKLIKISQRNPEYKKSQNSKQTPDLHSKTYNQRKQESQKIFLENQRLANRLLTSEAVTKKSELEKHYQEQVKIKQRITRSDWQLALPQSSKSAVARNLIGASFDRFRLPNVPAASSMNRVNMSLQFPTQPSQERPYSVSDQRAHTSFSMDRSNTLNQQNFRMNTEPVQQNKMQQQSFYFKNPYLHQNNSKQHNLSQDFDEDIQIDLNDSQINLNQQNNQQIQQGRQFNNSQMNNYDHDNVNNNLNMIDNQHPLLQLQMADQSFNSPNNYQYQGQIPQQMQQYGNKENMNKFNTDNYSNNPSGTNSTPWSNTNKLQGQQNLIILTNQNNLNSNGSKNSLNSQQQSTAFNRNNQYKNLINYNNVIMQHKKAMESNNKVDLSIQ